MDREGPRNLYVATCYFPPTYSRYALEGKSSYLPIYEDIMRYASIGEILLVVDFNAHTQMRQTSCFTS